MYIGRVLSNGCNVIVSRFVSSQQLCYSSSCMNTYHISKPQWPSFFRLQDCKSELKRLWRVLEANFVLFRFGVWIDLFFARFEIFWKSGDHKV